MTDKIIQILIVDDSAVSRDLLTYIVESDPTLHVMGTANDGEEALNWLKQNKPDVVLMDIVMPKMNGFEATRKIMETSPLPIIIISGVYNPQEVDQCYQAISAGALAILEKPTGIRDPHYPEMAHAILQAIKTLADIKIKFPLHITIPPVTKTHPPATPKPSSYVKDEKLPIDAVGIGASVGGPQALHAILSNLPALFPVPILVVQQISAGFTKGLVDWLAKSCPLKIKLASQGEMAVPGYIYVAPDNYHLEVARGRLLQLTTSSPEQGFRPSIGHLFQSMAKNLGARSVGILLSGRGTDGIEGLLAIKQQGGITIVQDEETSVLFDKPQKAIQAGAAKQIIPLSQIPRTLLSLVKVSQTK